MPYMLWDADDIRDASEVVECIAMSQRTKKLLLAAIDSASEPERWLGAVTLDEIGDWTAEAAFQLLGENDECAPSVDEDPECENYPPSALFIEYAPNDPFQTPNLTPDGYLLPPWYNNPGIPLPGVLPGDAMVNFLSVPAFLNLETIVEAGLPRAHIEFTGIGQVEIEFVKVIQGGYVRVVQDANELTQTLIDLNSQALADVTPIETIFDIVIGESLNQTEIAEFHFETGGLHSLDLTFFPNVGSDIIVGMGGGIRRVTLCGLEQTGEANVPQFQVVDCELQWRPNSSATWETLVDLCAIQPPTIVRQDQTPPGNLEQSIGGAAYTEIANTDFLYRSGQWPMTGGLEINNAASEVGLTIYPQPAQVGDYNSISVRNKSNQQLFSVSPSGQFTLFDPTLTNYLQFYQTAGGNAILTKHTTGSHQFLIGSINTLVLQYNNEKGLAVGQTGQIPLSIVSIYAKAVSEIALSLKGIAGQTLDLFQVIASTSAKLFAVTALGAIELQEIIGFFSQTSTNRRMAASIDGYWSNTTDATREASLIVTVNDYAGAREAVRYSANGAVALIGEYGHEPAVQQTVVGDTFGIQALESLITALANTGRIVDGTTSNVVIDEPEVPNEPEENWCLFYDFTDQESWELDYTYAADHIGQYVASTGWQDEDSDPVPAQVVIRLNLGSTFIITGVQIEFDLGTSAPLEPPLNPYAGIFFGVTNQLYVEQYYGAGGSYTLSLLNTAINTRYLRINITDNSFGQITIRNAKVFGYGIMPNQPLAEACP